MTTPKADHNYIPEDYTDLYRHYMTDEFGPSLTHQLVRHFVPWGHTDEHEDLVNDIFERCMSKDMIARFDASKAS